jgi:hypothetical protein
LINTGQARMKFREKPYLMPQFKATAKYANSWKLGSHNRSSQGTRLVPLQISVRLIPLAGMIKPKNLPDRSAGSGASQG